MKAYHLKLTRLSKLSTLVGLFWSIGLNSQSFGADSKQSKLAGIFEPSSIVITEYFETARGGWRVRNGKVIELRVSDSQSHKSIGQAYSPEMDTAEHKRGYFSRVVELAVLCGKNVAVYRSPEGWLWMTTTKEAVVGWKTSAEADRNPPDDYITDYEKHYRAMQEFVHYAPSKELYSQFVEFFLRVRYAPNGQESDSGIRSDLMIALDLLFLKWQEAYNPSQAFKAWFPNYSGPPAPLDNFNPTAECTEEVGSKY